MASNGTKSDEKKETKKAPRVNMADKIGLKMSHPRVRTRIQETVNDAAVTKEMKQIKDRLGAIKEGKALADEMPKEKLENRLKELSGQSIRLQAETPMAMTAMLNNIVREALVSSFNHCLGLKKPTNLVKPAHMYDVLATKSVLTALFILSESFENELFKVASDDSANDSKKDSKAKTKDDKKVVNKQGFKTYIGHIIDEIKETGDPQDKKKYANIRVSDDLKNLLNVITKDIITVFAQIACNLCGVTKKPIRTIKPVHLEKAFKSQMLARHLKDDQYKDILAFMRTKSDEFKNNKDEQKKAKENENKKKEAERVSKLTPEERKKYDAEKAAKDAEKATKAANKAKKAEAAAAKKAAKANGVAKKT